MGWPESAWNNDQEVGPRRYGINASRECGRKIRKAHSKGGVFETETREVTDGRSISDADAILPAHSCGDINLLLKRKGGNLDVRLSMMIIQPEGESREPR